MGPQDPFRLALLAIFATTTIVVGYRRRQAASSGEKISRAAEGPAMSISLSLVGLTLWLAAILWVVNPAWFHWSAVPLPDAARWSGAAIGAACMAFLYWTLAHLGKNLTNTVVTRERATLVTTGPYAYVRHPFYVSAALLIAAVSLLAANWFLGLVGAVVLALLALRTPREEQMLEERFGDEYRAYAAATGRWWPKASGSRSPPRGT